MEPRIIRTEDHYQAARAEVEKLVLLDPDPESREGLRLELFSKLVEDYEKWRFRFAKPDPIEAIIFRMQEQGLQQKDIAPLLGGKNRVSEVLSRKRRLTKAMISALYQKLDIPLELLVQEPQTAYRATEIGKGNRQQTHAGRSSIADSDLLRGFEGFLSLSAVRSSLMEIPVKCGVYVVTPARGLQPAFLEKSGGGWFKGEDPSYSLEELRNKWVEGAPILYVGKAGPSAQRTLRKRILELMRFGSGEPAAHRGGRALWQLAGIWQSRIAWKIDSLDPLGAEQRLLAKFEKQFGRLPFANFRH